MALEPCPNCARRVSQQARFCVHCRTPIFRPSGAAIQFQRIDWTHELRKLLSTIRNSWLKLKECGPSTQVLFYLMVVSLLPVANSFLSMGLSLNVLASSFLIYALLMLPAFLAFLLTLLRRPFGLYGALAVFLFWFLSTAGMIHVFHEHESSSTLFLWMIIALVSGWGTIAAFREAAGGSVLLRLVAFAAFFALEMGTVWLFFLTYSS